MNARERAESAPLTWDPVKGGKRAWICFEDDKTYDLGSSSACFDQLADRMLAGNYYPPDVITFDGRFRDEKRDLVAGDRVLQTTSVLGITMHSAVEIYIAERTPERCTLGYVTTSFHHGRGIWTADMNRSDGHLRLRVKSIASPQTWAFWVGLPVARYFQLRARRRAAEEFAKLCEPTK